MIITALYHVVLQGQIKQCVILLSVSRQKQMPSKLQQGLQLFMERELVPDPRALQEILHNTPLKSIKIVDFKIIEGRRKYKLIWDCQGITMFKWEDLSNMRNFEELVYIYQIENESKIRYIQSQWTQYFLEGIVKKPYIYIDLDKIRSFYEEPEEDPDSSYELEINKSRRRTRNKAMDFQILPNLPPVNKKITKKKRIRKRYTKKEKNHQFPSIESNDKNKEKQSFSHNLQQNELFFSDQSLSKDDQEENSQSWSLNIDPLIKEIKEKQKREELSEIEEIKENIQPQLKTLQKIEDEEINQKRQQIIRVCHQAMKNANRRIHTETQERNQQIESSLQIQEAPQEQTPLIQPLKHNSDIRNDSLTPESIFTSQQNSYSSFRQIVAQQEYSEPEDLHRSNVRSFLIQKMKKLNIDISSIEVPKKENDGTQENLSYSRVLDSPILVRDNKDINPYETYQKVRRRKRYISISYLLKSIQQSQAYLEDSQTSKTYLSNENYIQSRIFPYSFLFSSKAPKIIKINGYFTYKTLLLYSINVGSVYDSSEMFTIRQTLIKLCPQALQIFHGQTPHP